MKLSDSELQTAADEVSDTLLKLSAGWDTSFEEWSVLQAESSLAIARLQRLCP
jgi:plasmid maintenance system antidote protein VapI